MFISTAWAQTAANAAGAETGDQGFFGGIFGNQLGFLVLLFFVFYVIVLRPQSQRINEQRKQIDTLQKGDKVVTGGGLVATVRKLGGEDEIELEIAPGVIVTALRSTIMNVRDSAALRQAAADKAARRQNKNQGESKA